MVDTADSKSAALMCVRVRISLPVPIKKIMLASSNGQDSGFSYQQSGFDSPCEYQIRKVWYVRLHWSSGISRSSTGTGWLVLLGEKINVLCLRLHYFSFTWDFGNCGNPERTWNLRSRLILFRCSSMVELPTVNRMVVGSSPATGAKLEKS